MEYKFCRRCGQPLTNVERHIYECPSGHRIFANCNPSVGTIFLTPDNQVLLAVRGIEPHKGMLDTIGGFVDGEETFDDAAIREIREEVGLEPEDYEPLRYLTSSNGHYPFQGEVLTTIVNFYYTRLTSDKPLIPTDDVAEIRTIPLTEVNMAELHDDDIRAAVTALQKLFTTDTPADKE